MPNSRFYSSIAAATNLQVTASPSDTSIQVASSVGWPGSFPFVISLDYGAANEELVLATSGGPNIFQVTRSYDGTSSSTHNAGAVVRHVSAAIDFTDSRTHEASATGVHGTTGQIVDTASVQSIANKTINSSTLNSPVIAGTVTGGATYTGGTFNAPTITNPTVTGGGSLTGTFTGTPTFNGAVNFTGGPQFFTNSVLFHRTVSTNPAIRVSVDGDSNNRVQIEAGGSIDWSSGSASSDVSLSRSGPGALSVSGSIATTGSVTAGTGLTAGTAAITTMTGNPAFTGQPTFTPVTAVDSAVFTNNVNWSLDSAAGRKAGGVTTIRVNAERSNVTTITADSKGNIPDTVVGTLNAGWRPIDGTMITNYDKGGVAEGSISIGNDGICTIKSLSPTADISLADTVNFSLTFVSST